MRAGIYRYMYLPVPAFKSDENTATASFKS